MKHLESIGSDINQLEGMGAYGLWTPTYSSSRVDLGALRAPIYSPVHYNIIQYSSVQCSTVQCSAVQYSTVQYSTVTGEEDGVRGWFTPYSTLCGVSVTGAASLVAECRTNM